MKKQQKQKGESQDIQQPKKRGDATGGNSSRTQKGDQSQKSKGKAEGRK